MAATTVFINGRIFAPTGPPSNTPNDFRQAMSVTGSQFCHLGYTDDEPIQRAINSGAAVVDLKNGIVLPG